MLGLLVVCLLQAPFVLRGETSYVRIHDSIEGCFAYQAAAVMPGAFDAEGRFTGMLGGLPPAAISSEPPIQSVYFRLLPPFWAYVAGDLVLRLVAFLGMFFLLRTIVKEFEALAALTALSFSMLPFFSVQAMSVSGQPALALAIVVLLSGSTSGVARWMALACCLLFPYCSVLPLVGVFLCAVLGLVWGGGWWYERRVNFWLSAGVALVAVGYVGANWGLISDSCGRGQTRWHREEFVGERQRNLPLQIKEAAKIALKTHYHASANAFPILWIGLALGLSSGLVETLREARERAWRRMLIPPQALEQRIIGVAVASAALSSVCYFICTDPLYGEFAARFTILRAFNFSRSYFLLPPILYLGFHCSLVSLLRGRRSSALVAIALALAQLGANIDSREWREWERPTYGRYCDFVNRSVFARVRAIIGEPSSQAPVGCVGFPPAMAMLNGFRTIGGYWSLYPLEYKHRFRKVIHAELEKKPELSKYFDYWGSRCYLFSAELALRPPVTKTERLALRHLDLDTAALKELGARYVLSALPILNAKAIGLQERGVARTEDAVIEVYVYELS